MFQIYLEEVERCEYLSQENKQNMFFFAPPLSEEQVSALIAQGLRHFGNFWFKPACPNCSKCHGIRINCKEFNPSKSQRKLLRKNSDLTFTLTNVTLDDEHLDLINRYHRSQHENFQWRYQQFNMNSYAESFLHHMPYAKEYQIRDTKGTLVGVGIVDITRTLQSSIYFFYDTSLRNRSIGIWTILMEIALCQNEGRTWLHLGLFNEDARTLSYKNRFSPYDLLPQHPMQDDAELILHTLFSAEG